jgi:hypothetical protein
MQLFIKFDYFSAIKITNELIFVLKEYFYRISHDKHRKLNIVKFIHQSPYFNYLVNRLDFCMQKLFLSLLYILRSFGLLIILKKLVVTTV